MIKNKKLIKFIFTVTIALCICLFFACAQNKESAAQDLPTQDLPTQDNVLPNNNTSSSSNENSAFTDTIENNVSLGKKYYYLGYAGIVKTEYYTINSDGTATYTHIMKSGDKVTFHQEINFIWNYAGGGDCILVHNGTKIIKGEQDDAFGISRVMRLSNNIIYWSTSGENTYYICEDYIAQIPNYATIINN